MTPNTKKILLLTSAVAAATALAYAIHVTTTEGGSSVSRLSSGNVSEVDKAMSRNYYGTRGYLPSLPRGIRNNNAGNLIITKERWKGQIDPSIAIDKTFMQFITFEYGLRAMLKDLMNDINKGKNTIEKVISEYAPKSENNTTAYINSVSKVLSIKPTDTIKADKPTLKVLSKAISMVENGLNYPISDTQFEIAYNLI